MFYSRDLSFDFTNQDIENWSRGGEHITRLFNSASASSGTMFVQYVFADPLNLINTDQLTFIFRLVQTA